MKFIKKTLIYFFFSINIFICKNNESKVFIRSVSFIGNNNITKNEIFYITRQKPPSLFTPRPEFDPRLLRLDVLTLKNFYFSKGFLDIALDESYTIEEISEKKYVDIVYNINEGNQYYLSKVDIKGNFSVSDEKIKRLLNLRTELPYNPVGLNNNLFLIENEYHEIGKLFPSISIQDIIKDSVSVSIVIKEGTDIYINDTNINRIGNIDTAIVMRELLYNHGDLYSKSKIDKTAKHLREIGIFSTANLIPTKVANSDSLVDIVIELRRYKQREWNSSGGLDPISFAEGTPPLPAISAIIEWKNRALFNTPKQFSMKILAGIPVEKVDFVAPRLRYDAILTSNWIFGIRFPTKLIGYFEKFIIYDKNDYRGSIDRYGANLAQRFQLDGRSFFETRGNWEYFSDKSDYNIEERSISLKLNIDKKDNHLFTKNGYHFQTIIKAVGLGGARVYNKTDITFNLYKSIFKGSVFASRLQVGKLWNWNKNYKDYSYEKFYLGGSSSMRGWEVLRFNVNNDGDPYGGTFRIMTNIELRQKLYKSLGLTIFADGGFLSDEISENIFPELKWDAGIGFTIDTPLGPIRIDYAYQISNRANQEIQFGLQSLF